MIGDDEVFDSRDVAERISEIESERPCDRSEDEAEELALLVALADGIELEYDGEWSDGITFIRDDWLADHAREYAADTEGGAIFQRWPFTYIDWDDAGEALAEEYRQIEWRGITWYYY